LFHSNFLPEVLRYNALKLEKLLRITFAMNWQGNCAQHYLPSCTFCPKHKWRNFL